MLLFVGGPLDGRVEIRAARHGEPLPTVTHVHLHDGPEGRSPLRPRAAHRGRRRLPPAAAGAETGPGRVGRRLSRVPRDMNPRTIPGEQQANVRLSGGAESAGRAPLPGLAFPHSLNPTRPSSPLPTEVEHSASDGVRVDPMGAPTETSGARQTDRGVRCVASSAGAADGSAASMCRRPRSPPGARRAATPTRGCGLLRTVHGRVRAPRPDHRRAPSVRCAARQPLIRSSDRHG